MSGPLASSIAPALPGDVAELESIAAECGLSVDFAAELARSYALLLVARSAQVSGFLLAWRAADEVHLTDLGVRQAYRRRGIARALVSALIEQARAAAARVVLLEVRASNAPAMALYAGLGFSELDRRPRYYSNTGEDAVVMQLALR
jgi:[ribosomal protein S18]-alanine N-acetyltransferase